MTRKLLLTAAIVALTLAPRSALGLSRPVVFTAAASGAAFTAASGVAFTAASGAAFTAASAVSIRAITAMAISRTAITVTDRLQLAP